MQQVPPIAIQIDKDGHCAVWLVARLLGEAHAALPHGRVILLEIVGVEKEEDAPAGLVADMLLLRRCDGPRQQ